MFAGNGVMSTSTISFSPLICPSITTLSVSGSIIAYVTLTIDEVQLEEPLYFGWSSPGRKLPLLSISSGTASQEVTFAVVLVMGKIIGGL